MNSFIYSLQLFLKVDNVKSSVESALQTAVTISNQLRGPTATIATALQVSSAASLSTGQETAVKINIICYYIYILHLLYMYYIFIYTFLSIFSEKLGKFSLPCYSEQFVNF